MKVIVNADDFGFHENANKAICEGFAKGFVSNTTAMVTMPAFEAGLEMAKREGFADRMGLHVNLSEGTPLTDGIKRSRIFCDKEGNFNNCIREWRLWRFWLPAAVKPLIADEIRAQMQVFCSLGLKERHYDSHGQVCVYWPILPIALQCAKEFGFKTTRMFINMSANPRDPDMSLPRKLYISRIVKAIGRSGLSTTTHLGNSWDLARMVDDLSAETSIEVMSHPQYRLPNNELSDSGAMVDYKTPYDISFGAVMMHRHKFDLISFNEI